MSEARSEDESPRPRPGHQEICVRLDRRMTVSRHVTTAGAGRARERAACDDRIPLNRLTRLRRRCDRPVRPRVLEEAKTPALLARGPGGAR